MYTVVPAQMLDLGTANGARELRIAAQRLKKRTISLDLSVAKKMNIRREMSWVQTIEYDDNDSFVRLRFNHDMIPFLADLCANFTKISYKEIAGLTAHAVHLYTLFVHFRGTGWWQIKFTDLLRMLGLENSSYKSYGSFKQRVLDPAIKQILESNRTTLVVGYEELKFGRTVRSLKFSIANDPTKVDERERAEQLEKHKTCFNLTPVQIDYLADLLLKEKPHRYKPSRFINWAYAECSDVCPYGYLTADPPDVKQRLLSLLEDPDFCKKIFLKGWMTLVGFHLYTKKAANTDKPEAVNSSTEGLPLSLTVPEGDKNTVELPEYMKNIPPADYDYDDDN
jgi:hypothetical protein